MVAGVNTKIYKNQGGSELVVEAVDGGQIFGQATAGGTPAQAVASANLTDSSTGTASDTIAAIGATYNQDEVRDAVASLAAKVNDLMAAARNAGIIAQ